MAKQVGPVFFTGTIDGLIFYKLGDSYYTRSKGSYKSAKHMRRNPRYARTMQRADQFGAASKLAQDVYYRHLPRSVRKHGLFGQLTGMVNRWLQEGKQKEEVQELLIAHCQSLVSRSKATTTGQPTTVSAQPTPNTQLRTTITAQPSTIIKQPKQARYLSKWKVKPSGRLQIPQKHLVQFNPVVEKNLIKKAATAPPT